MALAALGKSADRDIEQAQRRWVALSKECADGRQKLVLLRRYAESYRAQLESSACEGLAASQAVAITSFIRRIGDIVAIEELRVQQIEETSEREYQRLVEARRYKRMIDLLIDRNVQRKVEAELRRGQLEIDDLIGRAGLLQQRR